MDVGYFRKQDLIDKISREMYSKAGYEYQSRKPMNASPHPTERFYWDIAEMAVNATLDLVDEVLDEENEEEEVE